MKLNSFSVVATEEIWKELAILIFSLRRFHTQPIYVLCDDYTKERVCHKSPHDVHTNGVVFDVDANLNELMKTEYNPDSVKNSYHRPDCIAKKMDCIERATALFGNTLFLDADIVAVGPLYADITKPVMVSPHYHANDVDKNIKEYGVYNAGYVFNSEPELPEFWRDVYKNRSSFYEQQGMVYFHEKFDVGKFPPSHNIGFWRYPKRSGRYEMMKYPESVKSFHAHLTSSLFGRAPQGLLQAYESMKAYVMSYLNKAQPEIYTFATSL